MESNFDENVFFRNATLRICSTLEIDKALHSFLLYVRSYVPADFMGFLIYLPDQELFETIAVASPSGSNALSVKIDAPMEQRSDLKKKFYDPRITVSNRFDPEEPAGKVIQSLGWPKGASIIIEMVVAGKRMGALMIINEENIPYGSQHVRLLASLNEPLGIALTNCLRYRKLQQLRHILADDKKYLQNELFQISDQKIIGADHGLKGVMEAVYQVAPNRSPVLLLGETGVGKEVIAKAIHGATPRRNGPFIKVNCGAITETLIDSELFGHERGAFTGAVAGKRGRFERSSGGTIFLDEIGELPHSAQVRLLRVIQDQVIERVGGEEIIKINSRVIAATHRSLEAMIRDGGFREDLYYRLKVFPIHIPPLRERKVDIPSMVQHFMQKKALELALPGIPTLAPGALENLMSYAWPGNVRELENAVERALICQGVSPLRFDEFSGKGSCGTIDAASNEQTRFSSLDQVLRESIHRALESSNGRIEGPAGAARLLNIHPSTLRQKMRKLGIPFGRRAKQWNSPGSPHLKKS